MKIGDKVRINYVRKSDDEIHIYEGIVAEVDDDAVLLAGVTAEHYSPGEVGKIKRFLTENILDDEVLLSAPLDDSAVTSLTSCHCRPCQCGAGDSDDKLNLSTKTTLQLLEILVDNGVDFKEAMQKVLSFQNVG